MENNSSSKIVLVTGSNRGLGFGLVKILLTKGYRVVLTSRSEEAGKKIFSDLQQQYPEQKENLYFCPLDISDKATVEKCAEWVKATFGQIDVLFNNAATSFGESDLAVKWLEENNTNPDIFKNVAAHIPSFESPELFDGIFNTNVFGTMNITELFLKMDLIKKNGKVITVASSTGNATRLTNESLKNEIIADDITLEKVIELCQRYKNAIINKTIKQEGWVDSMVPVYSNSKVLTQVYSKSLKNRNEVQERNIQVYALCPGWVATDLGGKSACRTVEAGCITPVYLIELPFEVNDAIQGKFFYTCKVYDWENTSPPIFEP